MARWPRQPGASPLRLPLQSQGFVILIPHGNGDELYHQSQKGEYELDELHPFSCLHRPHPPSVKLPGAGPFLRPAFSTVNFTLTGQDCQVTIKTLSYPEKTVLVGQGYLFTRFFSFLFSISFTSSPLYLYYPFRRRNYIPSVFLNLLR